MLLHSVDRPFDREHFDCELKIDGYRIIGYGSDASFYSRNGKNLTRRFREMRDVATRFGDHRAIVDVDGEVAAFVRPLLNGVRADRDAPTLNRRARPRPRRVRSNRSPHDGPPEEPL
jgi:ATP-dependent DNA ligase